MGVAEKEGADLHMRGVGGWFNFYIEKENPIFRWGDSRKTNI